MAEAGAEVVVDRGAEGGLPMSSAEAWVGEMAGERGVAGESDSETPGESEPLPLRVCAVVVVVGAAERVV